MTLGDIAENMADAIDLWSKLKGHGNLSGLCDISGGHIVVESMLSIRQVVMCEFYNKSKMIPHLIMIPIGASVAQYGADILNHIGDVLT